jgi:hypothetical protein
MEQSLGRYDIYCATMSMGNFMSAPKTGRLKRLNHYLQFLKKPKVQSVSVPNPWLLCTLTVTYDWAYSVR